MMPRQWSLLRVLHWGPLLALSIIGLISIFAVYCSLQWWPIVSGVSAKVNIVALFAWQILILYNFFAAMYVGPGVVPYGWNPKNPEDKKSLQFCSFCDSYKVPRSHHCRKCQRCVMKMDHHCPWINNCVGHRNHATFTSFLFFAPCGCVHAMCVIMPAIYRAVNMGDLTMFGYVEGGADIHRAFILLLLSFMSSVCAIGISLAIMVLLYVQPFYVAFGDSSEPIVILGFYGLLVSMFAIGMAIGVTLAVGALFVLQMRSILRNETGVETWIKSKASYRDRGPDEPDFVFPYDVGRWQNLRNVLYFVERPEMDGIWWPVRDGCTQFTLTLEQIAQKQDKHDRSLQYAIRTPYSGTICPLLWGPRVCCCSPCTDEPRMHVNVGDTVLVSRWKKHWLYGDKTKSVDGKQDLKRVRGWFPRVCAIHDLTDEDHRQLACEDGDNATQHDKADGDKKLD